MRPFGKVHASTWSSLQREGLTSAAKLVFVYLLSSAHTNMLGCFRLPMAYAVADLASSDMGEREVRSAFRELMSKGFITYEEPFAMVLIPNFLRWNRVENENQGKAVAKLASQVPAASAVFGPLVTALRDNSTNLPNGLIDGLETLSQGYRNIEMEIEIENETEKEVEKENEAPASAFAEQTLSVEAPPSIDRREESEIVEKLFLFYCESVGRSPKQYQLTAARKSKALNRLSERRKAHDGDLQAAARDLASAIENLAASHWHMTNGFVDWCAQIFKSQEEFEARLNWREARGGKSYGSNSNRAEIATGSALDSTRAALARINELDRDGVGQISNRNGRTYDTRAADSNGSGAFILTSRSAESSIPGMAEGGQEPPFGV